MQTVECWTPPEMLDGFTTENLNTALRQLSKGTIDGRRYSVASAAGEDLAAWRVLHEVCPTQTEERCRKVITAWVKSGVLTIGEYLNEKTRKPAKGIIGVHMVGVKTEWGNGDDDF